jgi:hypothetical protein
MRRNEARRNKGRGARWPAGGALAAALIASMSLSASAGNRQSRPNAADSAKVAEAIRVERAPRMDGTLDDPLWQQAIPITDFRQREPFEGQPATEKTEVRILYTRREVYFGIVCRDSSGKGIVATELRRDVSLNLDDYFEILIDSARDRRNAYVFALNALGTQQDGLIAEEQAGQDADFDSGWDGVWTSAARTSPEGWTATVAIPFSTLNFTQFTNVIWGVNFKRFIRRKNEEDLWTAHLRVFGLTKVSEAGELRGINDIDSGRLFIIKPYVLGGVDRETGSGTKMLHTGGIDIKYGLRSNLVANLTANTDFADADVDQEQFNLTPYRLFFPEKRQFFLENEGVFDFFLGHDDRLFFSRQIGIDPVTGQQVPINGGAKVTGTLGKYQLGVMDVETRSSGPNPYANYGVVRVKRSLFGDSYIGVMGIDKRSGAANDHFNQSGGVDTRLVFLHNLIVRAWASRTRTPGISSGDTDLGIWVVYHRSWFDIDGVHKKVGPNYNPEVGFLERNDTAGDFLDLTLKQRPKIRGIRELQYEGFIFHVRDTAGALQTQEWQATFRTLFNNGGYTDSDLWDVTTQRLTSPFNIYKNIMIPAGIYHFARHQITYGSAKNHPFTFSLFERFGTYYDGHLNEARIRANYRPNPRFSVSVSETWNRFRLPEGNFSVDLASAQANYSFSRFLTFSSVLQLDTANAQGVSANLRLRYNYRPDSDLYIIYNVGTQFASLAAANPQQLRETRFAIKFTYSFRPEIGSAQSSTPGSTSPRIRRATVAAEE